jgi:hypothetical protein
MNIDCFTRFYFSNGLNRFLLETPVHNYNGTIQLKEYTVQKGEEMRLDLIIESIYGDISYYKDVDVILYINGIDNPLNIREDQVIKYPNVGDLPSFRYTENGDTPDDTIKRSLAVVNKSTRVDKNRAKFVENDYSLPPILLNSSNPPVTIDVDKIIVGGLK